MRKSLIIAGAIIGALCFLFLLYITLAGSENPLFLPHEAKKETISFDPNNRYPEVKLFLRNKALVSSIQVTAEQGGKKVYITQGPDNASAGILRQSQYSYDFGVDSPQQKLRVTIKNKTGHMIWLGREIDVW